MSPKSPSRIRDKLLDSCWKERKRVPHSEGTLVFLHANLIKLVNCITITYICTCYLAAPEDTGAWSEPGGLPGDPGGYHRRTSGMSERMGHLETNTATSSSTYSRHRNAMLGHPSQGWFWTTLPLHRTTSLTFILLLLF